MKRNQSKGLFGLALCGMCALGGGTVLAQPTVQVVWEAPSSKPLLDKTGKPLTAGLATAGDGAILELGYYDAGTVSSPFQGKFIALTGVSSAVASLRTTSVGDSGGEANGTFSISTNFKDGAAVFQGDPPESGTPLVIRFYDGKTVAASKYYNAVSGAANWLWKAPAEAPGSFVVLSLADSDLVWQGGLGSAFKTTLEGPPPAINQAVDGGGSSGGESSNEFPAMIGAALSLNVPEANKSATYRSTELPPGLRLNTSTGVVSGVPSAAGNYAVTVTPVNSSGVAQTGIEFKINVAPIAKGVVGKFIGLVERSAAANSNRGGQIQLTTTAAGGYSGRVYLGTRSYSITGKLGLQATHTEGATIVVALPQLGSGAQLELGFDGSTQSFSGTLSNKSESASVSGVQAPWSAAYPANSLKGAYAFRLSLDEPGDLVPEGYGYGKVNVAATSGIAAISGVLADGSKVSGSVVMGKAGELAVYCATTSVSVAGWLALEAAEAPSSANSIGGGLSWLRPAGTGTVYAAGFGPVNLQVEGGTPVIVPAKGLVLGLEAVSEANPMNAKLTFAGGGLEDEFSRDFAVKATTSAAKNTATIPDGTPTLTLPVINPSTGAFSGTFVLAGTSRVTDRTVVFQGQAVTIGGETRGYGYFLMPVLPTQKQTLMTSPKLSGSVIFESL